MSAALNLRCPKTPRGEPRPIECMARTKSVAKGLQEAYVAVYFLDGFDEVDEDSNLKTFE